jgi:UDP:flavonoid glycosyltransferase YjiC (YdhE family)
MSRFLFTWELGLNLGHLARLLPVASRLRARGHSVLVAVREVPAAAPFFGPAGISFVQAPHLPQGLALPERASGYADILLSQGWNDSQVLWGLTQSWHNLIRMFRPDAAILDHSPTARLATHIAGVPAVMMGNGFELPPANDPLPPFPGFSWATADRAAASERIAVNNANAVLRRFNRPQWGRLSELFEEATALYVTFPELDHYGARPNACYLGPVLGALSTEKVAWPQGPKRIFACLRPDTANVEAILEALHASQAAVMCFTPGFAAAQLQRYASSRMKLTSRLVDLNSLAPDADACVSYGAEGTVATFLLAGVPQLISPWHVEAHMAASRIEALGAAVVLRGKQTAESVTEALRRLGEGEFKQKARDLSQRYPEYVAQSTADQVADLIETIPSARGVGDQPLNSIRGGHEFDAMCLSIAARKV